MVLQILIEEGEPSIREALDSSIEELRPMLRDVGGQLYLPVNRIRAATEALAKNLADLRVVASANWRNLQIVRLENGTILVTDEGGTFPQALPLLRQIAHTINIDGANALGRLSRMCRQNCRCSSHASWSLFVSRSGHGTGSGSCSVRKAC